MRGPQRRPASLPGWHHVAFCVLAALAFATAPVLAGGTMPTPIPLSTDVHDFVADPTGENGIGPGTILIATTPEDGRAGCTASFVWEDAAGGLYLSTAGHCLLPDAATATHGAGADYDAQGVTVRACVRTCWFGGHGKWLDIPPTGTETLGEVVYARRAHADGTLVGWDFGLVRIPDSLREDVRAEMPTWGEVHAFREPAPGDAVTLYGNGVGVGEVHATKGRAGALLTDSSTAWYAAVPAAFGDSGSAVATLQPAVDNGSVRLHALGVATHGPGLMGTRLDHARNMVLEDAGLDVTPVLAR